MIYRTLDKYKSYIILMINLKLKESTLTAETNYLVDLKDADVLSLS